MRNSAAMSSFFLVYQRDEHTYLFRYHPANRPQLVQTLGRSALDPRLNFTWQDALILSARADALQQQLVRDLVIRD